jgi:hypothetical protein
MRWAFVAASVAFLSVNVHASETVSDEAASVVDMSVAAQGVTISAIPMPAPVIEVLKLDDPVARARAAKKLRLAKAKPSPTMMLTRTERRQVALLVVPKQPDEPAGHTYDQDDNYQGHPDELVLHRSFSRPRLVDEPANDETESDTVPAHIGLRLMLARLKAVETHALSQVADNDEPLSDSVLLRLKEARLKAVQMHQQKFG